MDEKSPITTPDVVVPTYPATPTSFPGSQTPPSPSTPHYLNHRDGSDDRVDEGGEYAASEREVGPKVKKDWRFWMIFTALMLIAFCAGGYNIADQELL